MDARGLTPNASVSGILRGVREKETGCEKTGEKTQPLAVAWWGGCNVSCYGRKEQRVSFKTASCGGKKQDL